MHTPKPNGARRPSFCLSVGLLLALAGCGAFPGRVYHPAHPKPRASKAPAAVTETAPAAATQAAPAVVTAPAASAAPAKTPAAAPQPGELLDRVVAVVNDEVILKSELDARTAEVERQIQAQGTPLPPPEVLQKQVLDQMVTTKAQLEQAGDKGITVSEDNLNQALTRVAARAGVSLDQLPDRLKKDGIDYNEFRQELREQIVVQDLQQQVLSDQLHISQQELQDQMHADELSGDADTQYHLAQILVATPLNPSPDEIAAARKKADDIYKKLKGGADFAATAVASSDDQNALKGGDLGWRKGSELPTIFTGVVTQMKPGDFSAPIQSVSGFHIVKLDELKQGGGAATVTQTHARHILIRPSPILTPDQAKTKIDAIYQQLKAGADFAKLAEEDSADPGSAKQGGDLGWLDPGTTVPEFQAAMDKLQPGEMSEPFQSQFGWHIVQVLGRRQGALSDEARKNQAYEAIYQRKSEEVIEHWLSQLKDSAFIEYHLDQ